MRLLLFTTLFSMLFVACKEHKHTAEDPTLREALNIQDEAIHIGIAVDSIITMKMGEGAAAQNIPQLQSIKKQVEAWKHNMVIIPGLKHDHDHSDHASHDHAGHDHAGHDHGHDHSKEDVAATLSAADQLKVQTEWKAAIVALRDSLK
jgi:ABC-type Zn2+ transport system substrate-binding protein/surface adhesin